LLIAGAFACGPSETKREAERWAYANFFDTLILIVRSAHACDGPMKDSTVNTAALTAPEFKQLPAAVSENLTRMAEWRSASAKVCIGLRPGLKELSNNLVKAGDLWMDACIECAPAKACVAASRELRMITAALGEKDPEVEIRKLQELRLRPALCGKTTRWWPGSGGRRAPIQRAMLIP